MEWRRITKLLLECIFYQTNLLGKMCCEADEHQPALEESKQNTFRQKL